MILIQVCINPFNRIRQTFDLRNRYFLTGSESNDDGDDLFLKMAQWARDIPRNKYIELKRMLESKGLPLPSLRKQSQRLKKITGIEPQFVHCCKNNCIAYTGEYTDLLQCSFCGEERLGVNQKPRKVFVYIPLIPRLRLQYRDVSRARILTSYRESLQNTHLELEKLRDFFDGKLFREFHLQKIGLFKDARDIALHLSLDGVQLTNMRNH